MISANLEKFIRSVELASSPRRSDAIKSLVLEPLFENSEGLNIDDLITRIEKIIGIKPSSTEVIEFLESENAVSLINKQGNIYSLNDETRYSLSKAIRETKKQEEGRLSKWKQKIIKLIPDLSEEETSTILDVYIAYIYESFLEYDQKALELFLPEETIPRSKDDSPTTNGNILYNSLNDLPTEKLKSAFKCLINQFPNEMEAEDFDYFENILLKSECFLSLGTSKEIYNEINTDNIINWMLFLDTNFLYYVLDLSYHPQKAACKEIIRLVKNKEVNIKLRYLDETWSEFNNKKNELEQIVSRINFSHNELRVMLHTERLDEFSRAFFEEKLATNRAVHPADKMKHALPLLESKEIKPFKEQRFENLYEPEEYLENIINEYIKYERDINDSNKNNKSPKAYNQIKHDVFLREAILFKRGTRVKSISDASHFALTLDNTLMKFDKYAGKRKYRSEYVPVFFTPTFLLHKIRLLQPIKTNDYKKAFVQAITSKVFGRDSSRSVQIQSVVEICKNIGIDNPEYLFNRLTDDLFLDEFNRITAVQEKIFFVKSDFQVHLDTLKEQNTILDQENQVLKDKLAHMENDYAKKIADFNQTTSTLESKLAHIESSYEETQHTLASLQEKQRKTEEYEQKLDEYKKEIDAWNSTCSSEWEKYWKSLTKDYRHNIIYYIICAFAGIPFGLFSLVTTLYFNFFKNTSEVYVSCIKDNYKIIIFISLLLLIFSIIGVAFKDSIGKTINIQPVGRVFYFLCKKKKLKEEKKNDWSNSYKKQNPAPEPPIKP